MRQTTTKSIVSPLNEKMERSQNPPKKLSKARFPHEPDQKPGVNPITSPNKAGPYPNTGPGTTGLFPSGLSEKIGHLQIQDCHHFPKISRLKQPALG